VHRQPATEAFHPVSEPDKTRFGLDDEHIDFDRRTLRVDQQLILLPRREPILGPPKTSASHRAHPAA
jgi:hypothetical protein